MAESRRQRVRVGAYARVKSTHGILLVKMGMGPFKGAWSLPGGGLDFAEEPLQGMMREVKEETGIDLKSQQCELLDVVSFKTTWHDVGVAPEDLHFVGVVYEATLNPDNLKELHFDGDGESSEIAQWFSKEELQAAKLSPIFEKLIREKF
jgi:8-oxo-dGTP diphosphatase